MLPREDIVWCPVFKAASSSWLSNLLALSYLPRGEQERARERNPKAPLKLVKPISRPIPTASSYQADKTSLCLLTLNFRTDFVKKTT